jgi:hypothetical protein
MAYDEKTRTINIGANDTEGDFAKDLFAHMAHVDRQIAKDYPTRPAKKSAAGIVGRLQSLSRPVKASVVFMVFWTAFVIYRTDGSHELLGIYLERWDDDSFFTNWLLFPLGAFAAGYAFKWVMSDRGEPPPVTAQAKRNPLAELQKDLESWKSDDAKIALLLIKASLIGDKASIDRLAGELTVEQFRKVVGVVEQMRGDKKA